MVDEFPIGDGVHFTAVFSVLSGWITDRDTSIDVSDEDLACVEKTVVVKRQKGWHRWQLGEAVSVMLVGLQVRESANVTEGMLTLGAAPLFEEQFPTVCRRER